MGFGSFSRADFTNLLRRISRQSRLARTCLLLILLRLLMTHLLSGETSVLCARGFDPLVTQGANSMVFPLPATT